MRLWASRSVLVIMFLLYMTGTAISQGQIQTRNLDASMAGKVETPLQTNWGSSSLWIASDFQNIQLEWRTGSNQIFVGDTLVLELWASSITGETYRISGLDLIFSWDPSYLELMDVDNTGAEYSFYSGFPAVGGQCGLNETVPPADGLGLYRWLGLNLPVSTDGLLLTRFQFLAIAGASQPTTVAMEAQASGEGHECQTEMISGLYGGLPGGLDSAGVTIFCSTHSDCELINPCVVGECNTSGICEYTPVEDGLSCADELFCNGQEVCLAGECLAEVLACQEAEYPYCDEEQDICVECLQDDHCLDGVFCNGSELCEDGICRDGPDPCEDLDHCDEEADRCIECFEDEECDDGNPCTTESCIEHVCEYDLLPDETSCSDGDFCNGEEICVTGNCEDQEDPCSDYLYCDEIGDECWECIEDGECDDENACTTDVCDNHVCVNTELEDGASCSDGLFCNGTEECQAGVCMNQEPPCSDSEHCDEESDSCWECISEQECNDDNVCTENSCVDHTCVTQNLAMGTPCENEQWCDGHEACFNGHCLSFSRPCRSLEYCDEENDVCYECLYDGDCDDYNSCTTGSCIDKVCEHIPVDDGTPCLDDLFCNGQEACDGGVCQDGEEPCIDLDHCDEDGDVCYECVADAECDDGNPCTDDSCIDHVCERIPVDDGTACLDDFFCNGQEECRAGNCEDQPDPCIDDEHCDEVGDVCYECISDAECEDNNPCTEDTCVDHACDNVPVDDGSPCPDEYFCNGEETCVDGACSDQADPCIDIDHCDEVGDVCFECIADAECDDGNSCTDDACVDHVCERIPVDDGTPCLDDFFCNGQEECRAGNCEDRTDPCIDGNHCDEAEDVCYECISDVECEDNNPCTDDACIDHSCSSVPVEDGTPCLDDLFCNGQEACDGGICQDGEDPCIDLDHCDETGDVCFECVVDAECDDENPCTDDACVDHACDRVPVDDGLPCLDEYFCNGEETCVDGACSDQADPCIDIDHCDEAEDVCYECVAEAECDDGNPCTDDACIDHACDSVPVDDGTPCLDDFFCNGQEECRAGNCEDQPDPCIDDEHCDEVGDVCYECVADAECDDGNPCTDDACVDHVCERIPVDDGTACLDDFFCNGQEECRAGNCEDQPDPCIDDEHCDEVGDVCYECVVDAECDDENPCTDDACVDHACDRVPVDDGLPCLDEYFCNGEETCVDGACSDQADPCIDIDHCDEAEDVCYECVADAECDDDRFCTGEESCIDYLCVSAGNPCDEPGLTCIEELDECVSPPYISHIYQDNGAVRSMASNVNPDGPASIQARLAGMTTCTIQFSEDVVVGPEDILIRDVDNLTDESFPSGVEYDSDSYSLTMTWADNTFRNQWVRIHVLDSVKSAVTGVSLDGEILMPSARSSGLALDGLVPSGDGIPGGDSQFVLGSLVGDVNGNGIVNVTDRGVLQYNIGKVCPEGDLPSDINGNCIINVTDRGIIQSNIGATLPALPLP